MKNISIFYLFLGLNSLSLIVCQKESLFKECDQNISKDSLSLICQDDSRISPNGINSSLLVDFKVNLKLKGIKSLQLINSFEDEINLKSFDLSNNFNILDDFMAKINSFRKPYFLETIFFCVILC